MSNASEPAIPVRTRAILLDRASLTVLWMNESALRDLPAMARDTAVGATIEKAVPMAGMLGLAEALRDGADTGEPRHLRKSLVGTSRGSAGMAASVYVLPDDRLLVLIEQDFQGKKTGEAKFGPRRRAAQ